MNINGRTISINTNQISAGNAPANENSKPVFLADAILLALQLQKTNNTQTMNNPKNQDTFVSHDGNIN